MEITVKMTAEEYAEFAEWSKDRDTYKKKTRAEARETAEKIEHLASAVLDALEPLPIEETELPEYKIKSQAATLEAWDLANDVFA